MNNVIKMSNHLKYLPMKRVELTHQERLRLQAVSDQEKHDAFEATAKWVTCEMTRRGFGPDYGPLSNMEMGGRASHELAKIAYSKLFGGDVHWKPNRSLVSQMIYIAYSEMGHIIRDYYEKGKHLATPESHLNESQLREMQQAQKQANTERRNLGYEIARRSVSGNPQLLAYLDALYQENDYAGIRRRLKIPLKKVMELEAQLLSFFE